MNSLPVLTDTSSLLPIIASPKPDHGQALVERLLYQQRELSAVELFAEARHTKAAQARAELYSRVVASLSSRPGTAVRI